MSSKLKGLGKGLDSLISFTGEMNTQKDCLMSLDIRHIVVGQYQARTQIDEVALNELAQSIQAQGVIQPIIVREIGLDKYELIAGERRWRAAQLAGLSEIPAVVKIMDNSTAMAMGLIENIQREDLNLIEEAQGLRRLIDEFGFTHDAIAQALGRSRSAISNSLRLLKLPEPVQNMLYNKQLEMGHVRTLLTLPVEQQLDIAHQAVRHGWSVRETERHSKQLAQQNKPNLHKNTVSHPDIIHLSDSITQQLGLLTEIKTRDQKKGTMVVHFTSAEELQILLEKMGVSH